MICVGTSCHGSGGSKGGFPGGEDTDLNLEGLNILQPGAIVSVSTAM